MLEPIFTKEPGIDPNPVRTERGFCKLAGVGVPVSIGDEKEAKPLEMILSLIFNNVVALLLPELTAAGFAAELITLLPVGYDTIFDSLPARSVSPASREAENLARVAAVGTVELNNGILIMEDVRSLA